VSTTLLHPADDALPTNVAEDAEIPSSICLELTVTDRDSVKELVLRDRGADRDEYALSAMRIGLLSLKHACGQIDADAVKREGDGLLRDLDHVLENYRTQMTSNLTSILKEYFDPQNGRFQERVERLIKRDGDLEQAVRRQVGSEGSELAQTLAAHVGATSPLMKLLDPQASNSLAQTIREAAENVLQGEHHRILAEFSLDNKDSALSRMVSELTEENGRLRSDFVQRMDEVADEFSLDKEDSALSRLVRKVEEAQKTITREFSLDDNSSALSRMSHLLNDAADAINNNLTLDNDEAALARLRRELLDILKRHEEQATSFQREVTLAIETMKIKREEAGRSMAHGNQFEDAVVDFVQHDVGKSGDLASATGKTTGAIKYCKVGDAVVELGPDCAAAGERFVVEAKEDATYDLCKARAEIETARKNREATIGVFVSSKKTAPAGLESFTRIGNDVFVTWDREDLANDVMLKAALSLAKALCVREAKTRKAEAADFESIDNTVLLIESEAARLANMKTWTETIKSNSGKILEDIRKMSDGLSQQVQALKDAVAGLKKSAA
jgi:hypothetical protein